MNMFDIPSTAFILARLRAVKLKGSVSQIAVLSAMHRSPGRWISAEGLYRECLNSKERVSIGTLYRILNTLVQQGLLIRETNDNGKRYYRVRPSGNDPRLHRVECGETGDAFTFVDDGLREHLARMLRDRGLLLTEAPITVRVQCIRGDA